MSTFIESFFLFILPTTAAIAVTHSCFLIRKSDCKLRKMAVIVLGAALLYSFIHLFVSQIPYDSMGGFLRTFLNVLAAASAILVIQYAFEGIWYNKLLTALLFFIIIVFSEQILGLVINISWESGTYDVTEATLAHISSFFSLGIALVLKFARRKQDIHGTRKFSVLQVAIAAICVCGTVLLWVNNIWHGNTTVIDIILLCGFLLLLVLFYLSFELSDNVHRRNQEYALQQQRHELLEEYYKRVEVHQNEIRTMKHDMKNQLISLAGYIENGGSEKAARQIDDLISKLSAGDAMNFTAHSGMNALLGNKYRQAQAEDIVCDFTIKLPDEIAIKDNDLSALVGNVLDNAIEACRYCTGQKYIQFKLVYHGNTLILSSENSTDGNTETATRKGDTLNHGKGLHSIKRAVQQYGGNMQYQFHPGSFSLELSMFAPKV